MNKGIIGCVLLSILGILMWSLPNKPQAADVTMPPGKVNSVSFASYRSWQSPETKDYPSADQVAGDLKLVAGLSNGIRTYSSLEGNYDIGALAQQAGVKLWLGIWLDGNLKDNDREIAAGIAEANAHPDTITRVIVGNEVLLRRDLSADQLISYLDYVHTRVKQPIAYADVSDFWRQFPQIAPHVDVVMIHFLPYWEDKPLSVDKAITQIKTTIDGFKYMFPGKTISIGETGWPSRGRWRANAAPSRVNEAVYLRQFITLADQEHVDYNLIEAFDQVWKYQEEGVAGANWGIWNTNRIQKFPLNGGVVEHPSWPWYAVLGALCGSLLYASVGFRNPRLAVPAFALGNAYAIACNGTLPMLYDHWQLIDAIINLSLQAIFAYLVLQRADTILAGKTLPPRISAADTMAALRRGRILFNYDSLSFIFLISATIFEFMLIFDGRYRDAPMPVFIIPVVAAAFRFWLKDKPKNLAWEDIVVANTLALAAIVDAAMEGANNLDFITWNAAAILMAAPIIMATEGKRAGRKVPKRR